MTASLSAASNALDDQNACFCTPSSSKGLPDGKPFERFREVPVQRLLGKLNTAPSRTPAEGQRWVMVLRLV